MRDFRDAKVMAKSLRQGLSQRDIEIAHADALELVAKAFGYDNWNILAAKIEAAAPEPAAEPARPEDGTLYCSFCSKSQHEVAKLIAGPAPSFICDECVALCNNVIEETEAEAKMVEDEARGDAGWGALMAYMREKTDAQLRVYIETGGRLLAYMRKGTHQPGKAPKEMRYLNERLRGMSPDEAAKLVADLTRRADRMEIALDAARRVLAERTAG
jgi:hypothetical protein